MAVFTPSPLMGEGGERVVKLAQVYVLAKAPPSQRLRSPREGRGGLDPGFA